MQGRSRLHARDDPARLRSPVHVRFFTAVFERRLCRSFAAVRVSGDLEAMASAAADRFAGRPLVVYANHPSWWDAAVLAVLAAKLYPRRRGFAPIDAQSLERYRFLRRCGVFGVQPASRAGASALLRVGGALLGHGDALLCITPQGHFSDSRRRPLDLQRGLATLLARAPHAVAIPLAIEYPFWNENRPEVLLRLGVPLAAVAGEERDADAWQQVLEAALRHTLDTLAADAQAREPARFTTLLDGRVGVGGVYDLWRRAAAWSSGRSFDARHDQRQPRPPRAANLRG